MASRAAVRAARRRTPGRLDGIPSHSASASSAYFHDLLHRGSEVAAGGAKARGDGAAHVLLQQQQQQQQQQQKQQQLRQHQQHQQQGLRRGASSLDSCGASPDTVGREAVVGVGAACEGGALQRGRGPRTDEGSRRDADPSAAHVGGPWPLPPGIPVGGQRGAGRLRPQLARIPGDCIHLGHSRGQSVPQSTATSADRCHPSSWQLPRQLHHGSTVGRTAWEASFHTKRQTHLLDHMAPSMLAPFVGTVTAARRLLSSSSFSEPSSGLLALNSLGPNEGAIRVPKRVGRGIGSGKGKTAGRGHKGQKSRSGNKPRVGFEGGQTPLRLRLPKRGFHNPFSSDFQVVNLKDVVAKINEGKIDPSSLITMKTLKDAGMGCKAMRDGIKLLARGAETVTMPLHFEVSRVSEDARKAVEAAGGTVTRVHYNELGLRALLKPEWFAKKGRPLPRAARPPPRIVRLGAVDAVGRLPAPTVPMPMKLGRLVEGWGEGSDGKAEAL